MAHTSAAHDAPLELLRGAPRALLLLLEVAGRRVAAGEVEIVASDVHEAVPTHRAADLVALVRDAGGGVALVVIVEVQRRTDALKRHTWPLYAAQLEQRHKAPSVVVVLALESERVAAWARSPPTPWPTAPFAPLVVGPEAVAQLLAPSPAQPGAPHGEVACDLAVLGAMGHLASHDRRRRLSPEECAELTRALAHSLAAIRAISNSDRAAHLLALLQSVARRRQARAILNELLETNGMNTLERLKKTARLEGLAEGVALGKAEGVALGEAKGKAEGKAEALLRLLARKGFSVSPALRARVLHTVDVAQLDRWFDLAVDASTLEVVFASE